MNENYFNVIDTEEKAYWLGFIFADGNLRIEPSYLLRINLADKDVGHLEKFSRAIGIDRTPRLYSTRGYGCASVALGSKYLGEGLLHQGIVPRKSYSDIVPKVLAPLKKHFWRGVFDGDGSICRKKDFMHVSLNGNRSTIEAFQDFLRQHGIEGGSVSKHYSIFKYGTTGTKLPASIFSLLFDNAAVFLDRKMELGQTLIREMKSVKRI